MPQEDDAVNVRYLASGALLLSASAPAFSGEQATGPYGLTEQFLLKYEAWHARRFHRATGPVPSHEECLAAVPGLRGVFGSARAPLRERAARVAGWMYPFSDGLVDVLMEALEDDDARVRAAAALALGRFLPDAPAVVGALEAVLGDPDLSVRESAVMSLGELGPNSASAIDALMKTYVSDTDPGARAGALEALARADAERAAQWVSDGLASAVPEVRLAAAWSARWLVEGGTEDICSLLSCIVQDEKADHRLRLLAFEAIDSKFNDVAPALPALAAALDAPEAKVAHGGPVHDLWDERFQFGVAEQHQFVAVKAFHLI